MDAAVADGTLVDAPPTCEESPRGGTAEAADETRRDERGGAMASAGWGFLRHPRAQDIRGPRGSRARAPPPAFRFLLVMDFEWTCDNKAFPFPPEIIEFPAVLVSATFPFQMLDEFQQYVRPQECPRLTAFCTELTAITQATVDAGVPLKAALERFHAWLDRQGLVGPGSGPWDDAPSRPGGGGRQFDFAVVTWGDSDVMSTLRGQLQRLRLPVPPYFRQWINLKALFRGHYKREPTGGLQRVVERCGLRFEGRAHSGLVDSRNTAKIVQQMLAQGYRFTRPTRGLDAAGNAFGEKRKRPAGS